MKFFWIQYPIQAIFAGILIGGCGRTTSDPPIQATTTSLFKHHYIVTDLPDRESDRFGTPALADLDKDGDLDFAFSTTGGDFLWYEFLDADNWKPHKVGEVPTAQLGGGHFDVDQDGWTDLVIGGYWYRNPQNPRDSEFERYNYDSTITTEIHDLVINDLNGDGQQDVVVLGDRAGCFWYDIPEEPLSLGQWSKDTITLEVLDQMGDIHSGFFPAGIGDLDKDGDPDLVMPGRWYKNSAEATRWTRQFLPIGSVGYWGLSCRSWITDLDQDSDMDIIMMSSDQVDSRGAWLENVGDKRPEYDVHLLPLQSEGRRGSFHSLAVADFDLDGDLDFFTMDQEDDKILPTGSPPRGYLWLNDGQIPPSFTETLVFDENLGGHDALMGDVDSDGDMDLCFKIWKSLPGNANQGNVHAGFLENLTNP